VSESSGR